MEAFALRLRSDCAPWSPEVGGEVLRRHLPLHLLTLTRDLETGRYRPLPVRQYAVSKPDGGRRILSVYYLRDKLSQRLAVQVLEHVLGRVLHPDSFAYRPKRGVRDVLARARERVATGRRWVVDADIQQFFDSVPHARLRRILRRQVPDRRLRQLIDLWLAMGPYTQGFLGQRRGLLQGAVISPWLCNLYLDRLDQAWTAANIPFVRYADDFLLFAHTRQQAEAAQEFTRRGLQRLGLRLHPRKTRVACAESVRFLGEALVRKKIGPAGTRRVGASSASPNRCGVPADRNTWME